MKRKETRRRKKKKLEEYSEGVQKRIAKLTRKMREAERQREEALDFAESVKDKRRLKKKISKLEIYVSKIEKRDSN